MENDDYCKLRDSKANCVLQLEICMVVFVLDRQKSEGVSCTRHFISHSYETGFPIVSLIVIYQRDSSTMTPLYTSNKRGLGMPE